MAEDYPFTSWSAYARALAYALECADHTPVYYPEYGTRVSDYMAVSDMLEEGFDPHEGLDAFVEACALSPRYLGDFFAFARGLEILELFAFHGARPRALDVLFDTRTYPYVGYDFRHRAVLIDAMCDVWPDTASALDAHADWAAVVPLHYDDITPEHEARVGARGCVLSILKHHSAVLSSK